jgi:exopolyphosphatase/guanosine-5'-triphosphate,3'-diphosphate pyrophosphatase
MRRDPRGLPPAKEIIAPFAGLPVDWEHPRNVARLAIRLFDLLAETHGLGPDERCLLWRGALLHDVGYARGWQSHHKSSLRLILETPMPGLPDRTRDIVACIGRYHRGGDPKDSHPVYGELPAETREVIAKLAAILRVADGLDRGQVGRVEEVQLRRAGASAMTLVCYSPAEPVVELAAAAKKASLFESVYGCALSLEYAGPTPRR